MPYKIINWEKYQVRSNRGSNPWVMLHKSILGSKDFFLIPRNRRWEWFMLWCIAEHSTGIIDMSDEDIAFKLRYKDGEMWNCKPFIGKLLEQVDANGIPLATNGCREERRGEEIRGEEKEICSFEDFWKLSPRTGPKKKAQSQWVKLKSKEVELAILAIMEQSRIRIEWERTDPKHFVSAWPHMERWIRDKRWTDEIEKPKVIELDQNYEGGTPFDRD